MVNIGIIGSSEGNGHPYSFSSIVNGFNADELKKSGWNVIHDYLTRRDPNEIGIDGMQVTHVWTQSADECRQLAAIADIENIVDSPKAMASEVDAVIIARDDWQTHLSVAAPFLERGIPLFIDKPLTLDIEELRVFRPALECGQLMSTSGLRFATELDEYRQLSAQHTPRYISGMIVNSWEKYGIHLLDAIFGGIEIDVSSVTAIGSDFMTATISSGDGPQIVISCVGPNHKMFNLRILFDDLQIRADLHDNFTAFRRTLEHFRRFVADQEISVPASQTIQLMQILIAGKRSVELGRTVAIDEIAL